MREGKKMRERFFIMLPYSLLKPSFKPEVHWLSPPLSRKGVTSPCEKKELLICVICTLASGWKVSVHCTQGGRGSVGF